MYIVVVVVFRNVVDNSKVSTGLSLAPEDMHKQSSRGRTFASLTSSEQPLLQYPDDAYKKKNLRLALRIRSIGVIPARTAQFLTLRLLCVQKPG
jgi:hypothetical protein